MIVRVHHERRVPVVPVVVVVDTGHGKIEAVAAVGRLFQIAVLVFGENHIGIGMVDQAVKAVAAVEFLPVSGSTGKRAQTAVVLRAAIELLGIVRVDMIGVKLGVGHIGANPPTGAAVGGDVHPPVAAAVQGGRRYHQRVVIDMNAGPGRQPTAASVGAPVHRYAQNKNAVRVGGINPYLAEIPAEAAGDAAQGTIGGSYPTSA